MRVQVKCTLGAPGEARRFHLRQGYRNTGRGTRPYGPDEFDLVALVCLREGVVLFSAGRAGEVKVGPEQVALLGRMQRELFEGALHDVGALTNKEVEMLGAALEP